MSIPARESPAKVLTTGLTGSLLSCPGFRSGDNACRGIDCNGHSWSCSCSSNNSLFCNPRSSSSQTPDSLCSIFLPPQTGNRGLTIPLPAFSFPPCLPTGIPGRPDRYHSLCRKVICASFSSSFPFTWVFYFRLTALLSEAGVYSWFPRIWQISNEYIKVDRPYVYLTLQKMQLHYIDTIVYSYFTIKPHKNNKQKRPCCPHSLKGLPRRIYPVSAQPGCSFSHSKTILRDYSVSSF